MESFKVDSNTEDSDSDSEEEAAAAAALDLHTCRYYSFLKLTFVYVFIQGKHLKLFSSEVVLIGLHTMEDFVTMYHSLNKT